MKTYKQIRELVNEQVNQAAVIKGAEEYMKIGREKYKNHPTFKDLYARQKNDLDKSVGPKYIKIYNVEKGSRRSINCFIDKNTGDVLKPARFNAPAKGPRGNVLDRTYMTNLKRNYDTHGGHLYRQRIGRIFG